MEDFAISEAPVDVADSVVEVPSDTGTDAAVETGVDTQEGDQEQTGTETQPFKAAIENGKLSPQVKTALDKLKTENPGMAKALQRALFAEDRLRRELPGGFKDIQAMRQQIEQLGGDEGIQGLQAEIEGWTQFDNQYMAGDPKVLEFLTETPEAAASFLKIAPAAFDKFRELNPDGFASLVSQTFMADMMDQQIPFLLKDLHYVLQAVPETHRAAAQEVLDKLNGYVGRIAAFARKPVDRPAPAASNQPDQRQVDMDRRQVDMDRKDYRSAVDQRHSAIFSNAWKSIIGSRKLNETQLATVKELYGLKLAAIIKGKGNFNQKLDGYFNSRQKDGFVRHFESVYKEAVPAALRKALSQVGIGAKEAPKPGNATAPSVKLVAKGAPATGFSFVASKPPMASVDRVKTTTEMWSSGKAVLTDGKRIQWRKQ